MIGGLCAEKFVQCMSKAVQKYKVHYNILYNWMSTILPGVGNTIGVVCVDGTKNQKVRWRRRK